MIDWLTLKLPRNMVSPEDWANVAEHFGQLAFIERLEHISNDDEGHVFRGLVKWAKPKRESLRSDTHAVVVCPAYEFEICGSPARCMSGNNVFGSGDIRYCALAMIYHVNRVLGVNLSTDLKQWRCTRIDVTHNYDLGGPAEVRQALTYLRLTEGGHKAVSTEQGAETVYWNKRSQLRGAKAYHKGPHLTKQCRKNLAEASDEEQSLAARLLRLELSLKHKWLREDCKKAWHELTESDLDELHNDYFGTLIGNVEVIEMDRPIIERFIEAAKLSGRTEGRGKAAFGTWCRIKAEGLRNVQESMPKGTWWEHKRIMFDAGLTWADLQASNVVPFRRRTIELGQPVRSWDELRRAA